jgi:SAM-dependent methyltransferase
MARFDPESYVRYRISYPTSVFEGLRPWVGSIGGSSGIRVVDLGAGTGYSSLSLIRALPVSDVVLIEPDASMLDVAVQTLANLGVQVQCRIASGEDPVGISGVDLVMAASSWHWMDPGRTLESIKEMLRPGGAFYVFEYQFPKLEGAVEINEWVRREFNLRWRAEGQRPRGSLWELTQPVRGHVSFSQRGALQVEHTQEFTLEEFAGVIRSQSRYLAYEAKLQESLRGLERERMVEGLRQFWGGRKSFPGSYSLEGYWFVKRWG